MSTRVVDRSTSITGCIRKAMSGSNLSGGEMHYAIGAIMDGTATPAQIAALLVALAAKGETAEEIAGAALTMRAHAINVRTNRRPVVDVCGTGGDGSGTFNVSTAVAFVVAGAGVAVAKHGNRAMGSRCGSADVLAALGVEIDAAPEVAARSLDRHGIAFLFAQAHHPSMRHVAPVRREIGVRTLFNVLGPLTNPAGAQRQVVGVAQAGSVRLVAEALSRLGSERAAAVRGEDGMDELTLAGPSQVVEWTGESIREYVIEPGDLGFSRCPGTAIAGGDAAHNARLVADVLADKRGPHHDIVVLNAGLALEIAGAATDIADGCDQARRALASGAARAKLDRLVAETTA